MEQFFVYTKMGDHPFDRKLIDILSSLKVATQVAEEIYDAGVDAVAVFSYDGQIAFQPKELVLVDE